jgi:hypothetical protein
LDGEANKRVQFGYGLNYLIDIENAVIVDIEATPARTYDEVAATKTMIERPERRFDVKPDRLAADTAYGTTASSLAGSSMPASRSTSRCGTRASAMTARSRAATSHSTRSRASTGAPHGKALRTTGRVHDGRTILYRRASSIAARVP